MSHVFLPSDPRLKRLATQIEEERNHALMLEPKGEERRRARRAGRGRRGLPRAVVERAPRRRRAADHAARRRAAALRRAGAARVAGAGGVHDDARRPPRVEPETAFERRERLRAERRRARGRDRPPQRRVPPRGQRAHQPRGRRRVGGQVDGRATRAGEPAARARGHAREARMDALPEWPAGTVAVLSTGAGEPHAIPVSTAVRRGPRTIAFALALRRESLARLRSDPRCALTVLAAGNVAFTALGRATVVEERRAGRALRVDVERIQDHGHDTFVIDEGVQLALDRRRRRARRRRGPRRRCDPARAAVFDFGETLLSEERAWGVWADWIGVDPPGAVRGDRRDDRGAPAARVRAGALLAGLRPASALAERVAAGVPRHEELYDVYPDAAARAGAAAARRRAGRRSRATNRRARRRRSRALAPGDLVATSADWGVSKPDPAFFARVVGRAGPGGGRDRLRRRPRRQRHRARGGGRDVHGAPAARAVGRGPGGVAGGGAGRRVGGGPRGRVAAILAAKPATARPASRGDRRGPPVRGGST